MKKIDSQLMPSKEWISARVGDLGQVFTGRTPPSSGKNYFGDEFFFITPGDMRRGKRVAITGRRLSKAGADLLKRIQIPPRAVCVSCIGWQMGEVVMTTKTSFTNQQINSIVPNEAVDADFVYYSFVPRKQELLSRASATGVRTPIMNKSDFCNLRISCPPLPTQRKIAAILSTYDDLIENNTRRIKILEEMVQVIYKEWFINFRFPGREAVEMVDSSVGHIPRGWDIKPLSELVSTQYGYTESASRETVGPKYLRGMDINKTSYVDWNSVPYCPISDVDLEKYKLSKGDIVIIRMADPGKSGIVEKDISAVFASYLIRLRPLNDQFSRYFLFSFLQSERYQGYITGASTGTTRKSASAAVITSIDIVVPPIKVQQQFDTIAASLRSLLNNLLDQNANLRQTRDLLLPKLISGEVDVSELDIKLPEELTA